MADDTQAPDATVEALRAALEREPTLDEVREYGMDGSRGGAFNTLQWRLDLVRDWLAAHEVAEPAERATRQVAAPEPLREALEWLINHSTPSHDATCASQDDDDPCICGVSGEYERVLRAAAQDPEQARLDHTCSESCLHDCAACGHEVDHGPTFHAPDCLAKLTWPDQGPEQARDTGGHDAMVEALADAYHAAKEAGARTVTDLASGMLAAMPLMRLVPAEEWERLTVLRKFLNDVNAALAEEDRQL